MAMDFVIAVHRETGRFKLWPPVEGEVREPWIQFDTITAETPHAAALELAQRLSNELKNAHDHERMWERALSRASRGRYDSPGGILELFADRDLEDAILAELEAFLETKDPGRLVVLERMQAVRRAANRPFDGPIRRLRELARAALPVLSKVWRGETVTPAEEAIAVEFTAAADPQAVLGLIELVDESWKVRR